MMNSELNNHQIDWLAQTEELNDAEASQVNGGAEGVSRAGGSGGSTGAGQGSMGDSGMGGGSLEGQLKANDEYEKEQHIKQIQMQLQEAVNRNRGSGAEGAH
jgi:hypothetical protein